MSITIADTAWMAGLFEGEGSISISQKKGYCYLQLVSTDHDVLLKFADLANCTNNKITFCPRRSHQNKDAWKWQVGNKSDVTRLLNLMLPYLGDRRAHKALDVFDFYDDRNTNSPSEEFKPLG